MKSDPVVPVLKWAGGKRQLLDVLAPLVPKRYTVYCEPFVGGGAMLFGLRPAVAVANDVNAELINVYEVVRDRVDELIEDLRRHENTAEYYYAVRAMDRSGDDYAALSPVRRASRILYLNRTCYNGLYRVNKAGRFNTPFGRHKAPNIVNEKVLRAVGGYLRAAGVRFLSGDYEEALGGLPAGSFVYLDPPYHPVSPTASFTGYARGGFGEEEQRRLKTNCDALNRKGVKFMLSNSATAFIRELYREYDVIAVRAKRAVNSVSSKRGEVEEVVVRNYG